MLRSLLAVGAGYLLTTILLTSLLAGMAFADPDAFTAETLPSGTIAAVLIWGLGAGAAGGALAARVGHGRRGVLLGLIGVIITVGSVAAALTGYPHCWYRMGLMLTQCAGVWVAGRRFLRRRSPSP